MLGDFTRGLGHGAGGAGIVVARPRLWRLVLLPFALALAVLAGLAIALFALRDHLLPAGGALRPLVELAAVLALPVVGYFLFVPLASLVAAPFNDAISEAVEEQATGRAPPAGAPFTLRGALRDVARSLAQEARRFLRWLVLAAAIFAASVALPGIGSLVGLVGGGYLAARFAAWDAIDTPLSRWGWSYERKLAFLRARRPLCLGLGAFVALLLAIPIANALAMPLAAAGGTRLCLAAVEEGARRP